MSSFGNFIDQSGVTRLRATGGGGGGSSVTWSPPIVVDDATLKHLPTGSDIELVAAPGAGQMFVAWGAVLVADFAVAYAGIDADGSYLGVNMLGFAENTTSGYTDTGLTQVLTNTNVADGAWVYKLLPRMAVVGTVTRLPAILSFTAGNFANLPLRLTAGNGADFSGGDPANTLAVSVLYSLVPV